MQMQTAVCEVDVLPLRGLLDMPKVDDFAISLPQNLARETKKHRIESRFLPKSDAAFLQQQFRGQCKKDVCSLSRF